MRRLSSIIFALSLLVATASAQQLTLSQKALRGLRGLVPKVIIEKDGSLLGRLLTESSLQTALELQLRKNGLRVGTPADLRQSPMPPSLVFSISGMECETQIIYSVSAELIEIGAVERSPTSTIFVTSWQSRQIGSITLTDAKYVREAISDIVDKFINDWQAANP